MTIAFARSPSFLTFVTPTDEPLFAGLTKYGRRSALVIARVMRSRSCVHSRSCTGTNSTIGSFAAAKACFMCTLSIPIADAVTPRKLKPQDPSRPTDTRVLSVKVAGPR